MSGGVTGTLANFASCLAGAVRMTFQEKLSDLLRLIMAYWIWYEDMTLEGIICSIKYMAVVQLTMNALGCFSDALQGSLGTLKGLAGGSLSH